MAASNRIVWDELDISIPYSLAFCLLGVIILQHTPLPRSISYVCVLFTYLGICLIFVLRSDRIIQVKRFYVTIFLLFILVGGLSTFVNVTVGVAVRYMALLTFTTTTIFLVPKVIPQRYFFDAVGRLTAILVVLGFFPYFDLPTQAGFIDLSLWDTGGIYWYTKFGPITSLFLNPNAFGFLTFVGGLAAFSQWYRERTRIAMLLFILNTVGLAFTNYRAGWIAYSVAFGVFVVYLLDGRRLLMIVTVLGVVSLTITVMMIIHIFPGPEFITEASLNHRRTKWIAGINALQEQFWLGYGLGNVGRALRFVAGEPLGGIHNSFLRAFVAYGIGGGILYILLYFSVLFGSIKRISDPPTLMISMFLMGFIFIQLFNGLTFIGISLFSVIIALIMGYHITVYEPI